MNLLLLMSTGTWVAIMIPILSGAVCVVFYLRKKNKEKK